MGRFADAWGALTGKKASATSVGKAAMLAGLTKNGLPPPRGSKELLLAYSAMPRLRSVTERIATSVASAPWSAYRVTRGGPSKRRAILAKLRDLRSPHRRQPTRPDGAFRAFVREMNSSGELELLENHPALDLIERPNLEMTAFEARQFMQTCLDLCGEAPVILEKNMLGMPAAMFPVPPTWLKAQPSDSSPVFEFEAPGGWKRKSAKEDTLWIRHLDPANPYGRGSGIGRSLSSELDVDEYAAQTANAMFYNHGIPSLLVAVEGAEEDQLKRMKEEWQQQFRGHLRVGMSHFTNGKISTEQLTPNFVNLQLVELRKFEAEVITETFGVPPELIGRLTNSNRATIDAADLIMAVYVVVPRLEKLQDAFNARIVPLFDDTTILAYESPVPDDWEFKLNAMKARPETASFDDWREMQSLPPFEDPKIGRSHFVRFGEMLVDLVGGEMPESMLPTVPDSDNAPTDDEEDDEAEDEKAIAVGGIIRATKAENEASLSIPQLCADGKYRIPAAENLTHGTLPRAIAARMRREMMTGPRAERAKRRAARTVRAAKFSGRTLTKADDARVQQLLSMLDANDLIDAASPLWREQVLEWMWRELESYGYDANVLIVEAMADRHLKAFGSNRITGLIHETTREQIREALAEGLIGGENRVDLIERVQEVFDVADEVRAENIARTETLRSSNWAITQSQKIAHIKMRQWLSILDPRVREKHEELHHQIRGIDEHFEVPSSKERAMYPGDFGTPDMDCQCFPGDTLVQSASDVEKVYRRTYSGELIEVTTVDGERLTGTPNHPVLTQRGWVALGALNETDNLVRRRVSEVVQLERDDVNNQPITFEEVFDLASVVRSSMRMVAGGHQNFHGDGRNGEIDIVGLNSHLGDRVQPASLKHLSESPLALSRPVTRSLFRSGDPVEERGRFPASAHRAVRSGGEVHPLLARHPLHADAVRSGTIADLNVGREQASTHSTARDAEALADTQLALALLNVCADDLSAVDVDSEFMILGARPADFELRPIRNIRRSLTSCHVFNLQTASSWYLANNFVAHNCRCSTAAMLDEKIVGMGLVVTLEQSDAIWKLYDANLRRFEKRAKKAFRAGFRAQEAKTIALMETMFRAA